MFNSNRINHEQCIHSATKHTTRHRKSNKIFLKMIFIQNYIVKSFIILALMLLFPMPPSANAAEPVVQTDYISPFPPTINQVKSPTREGTQIVSGTKEPNTSILLNGIEVVSNNESGSWQYSVELAEGENLLHFQAMDSFGNSSEEKVVKIICYSKGQTGYVVGRIDHTLIDEGLTDFPVLLRLTKDLFSWVEILAGGFIDDTPPAFSVFDSNNTQCAVEIERWAPVEKEGSSGNSVGKPGPVWANMTS
ncbi:MAG: hypothetical protein AB1772_13310 [Candidatus Zixiibacteriota bacterium]